MKAPKYAMALLAACQQWMARSSLVDPKADLNAVANAARAMEASEELPKVVCLCGSTRFREDFIRANYIETMAGNIVLSVGFFSHNPDIAPGETMHATAEQKVALDVLHKRKIDLADEVLVLNVDGYVGSSTRGEVLHAYNTGKPVRWLEPGMVPEELRHIGEVFAREESAAPMDVALDDPSPAFTGTVMPPDSKTDAPRTDEQADKARLLAHLKTEDSKTGELFINDRACFFKGLGRVDRICGTVRAVLSATKGKAAEVKATAYVVEQDDGSWTLGPRDAYAKLSGLGEGPETYLEISNKERQVELMMKEILGSFGGLDPLSAILGLGRSGGRPAH